MNKSVYVVYDSGVGGLTVLNEIINQGIQSNFVYFADTKNSPYGTKEPDEIIDIVVRNFIELSKMYTIKGVILACNTASVLAKSHLESLLNVRVHTISDSIIEQAKSYDNVNVMATNATVKSGFFIDNLPGVKVNQIPCSSFVPFIESKNFMFSELRNIIVESALSGHKMINAGPMFLACTHFPFLRGEINDFYKGAIDVIDPSERFINRIKDDLKYSPFSLEFIVTGNENEFFFFCKNVLGWSRDQFNSELILKDIV